MHFHFYCTSAARIMVLCIVARPTHTNLENILMVKKTVITLLLTSIFLVGCSEEQQNKLSRLGVTWLEGDYKITFASGNHQKSWVIDNGKVTSDPQKIGRASCRERV